MVQELDGKVEVYRGGVCVFEAAVFDALLGLQKRGVVITIISYI